MPSREQRPEPGTWSGIRDPAQRAQNAQGHVRPPLPLTQLDALDRALMLRNEALTYYAISVVMGVYHGCWATTDGWRERLRTAGVSARQRDERRAA